MAKVNLDALIPREDFEVEDNINPGKKKETISIEDIKIDSFFFSNVRKPDFQRETTEWDSKKVCEFVDSFIKGDLIPAIILWRSNSGYLFVIDGSHRLSALAAWINDDYGDGKISKKFYDGVIPEEQLEIADETRKVIRKKVGTYEDYKLALTHPEKVEPEIAKRAKNLAALAIQLQWVDGGADKAENSFFKINQQAAPIDKTELILLESRKKPNCIAARAIIKAGKGHKYWARFESSVQTKVQEAAKEINEILFSPKLESPIKTLDIPIGGKLYSAQTLPLILELVNITNEFSTNFKEKLTDDIDGAETLRILQRTRKVVQIVNSNNPSSLGLHPIIYFYSQDGRHKVASFYATILFVKELEEKKLLNKFIRNREKFEQLLLNYDYLVQQILRKYRSAQASYPYIKEFYFDLLEKLETLSVVDTVNALIKSDKYNYLTLQIEKEEVTSTEFSKERKSAIYIKEAISSAPKCNICGGLIHKNSISIDHKLRKTEGGLGSIDNGQITHPYCNTGYKS